MDLQIPRDVLQEIDALVAQGVYPTREEAVGALLRMGLERVHERRRSPPLRPPTRPAPPPGVADPHGDDPISVDPTRDVREI